VLPLSVAAANLVWGSAGETRFTIQRGSLTTAFHGDGVHVPVAVSIVWTSSVVAVP